MMYYRPFPKEFVRRVRVWYIDSPFEIEDFACYRIRPKWPGAMNPCGEIKLGEPEWCSNLGFRSIESPFSLYSFTEYYVIGPWAPDNLVESIMSYAKEYYYDKRGNSPQSN